MGPAPVTAAPVKGGLSSRYESAFNALYRSGVVSAAADAPAAEAWDAGLASERCRVGRRR